LIFRFFRFLKVWKFSGDVGVAKWRIGRRKMERRWGREVVLVVLGVVLHSLYMLSIFDIYFKSPIVNGMEPEPLGIAPPARRLVLFIGE